MKRTLFPALSIFALSLVGVSFALQGHPSLEVSAYAVADLPTTIDLNDNTAEEIRSYY